jgi:hypothetical protein
VVGKDHFGVRRRSAHSECEQGGDFQGKGSHGALSEGGVDPTLGGPEGEQYINVSSPSPGSRCRRGMAG